MNKLFWLIYIQPLHRIMIFMILAAVLWGYLGNREQGSRRWRILNAAVFAGIAAVIFYMTVCARGEETAEAVLVPFQNFREAREQPELYRSMLMNVLLFFPSGCPCRSCWGNGSCPSPSRSCWRAFLRRELNICSTVTVWEDARWTTSS